MELKKNETWAKATRGSQKERAPVSRREDSRIDLETPTKLNDARTGGGGGGVGGHRPQELVLVGGVDVYILSIFL